MKESDRKVLIQYGLTIVIAVTVALLIRFFLIEAYRIPSLAMKPTLEPGDTIFVAKWTYGLRWPGSETPFTQGRMPERGEVVVFSPPGAPKLEYVKRVVALPGDTVQVKLGQVTLNGNLLLVPGGTEKSVCGEEKLLDGKTYGVCWEPPLPKEMEEFGPEKIPEDSVFVLGDMRGDSKSPASSDFRKLKSWGIVPLTALKGKALWIWLSIEPASVGENAGWFPQFRFERMLRRIP